MFMDLSFQIVSGRPNRKYRSGNYRKDYSRLTIKKLLKLLEIPGQYFIYNRAKRRCRKPENKKFKFLWRLPEEDLIDLLKLARCYYLKKMKRHHPDIGGRYASMER